MTEVELEAPPKTRSILVLQGSRLTHDQITYMRDQIDEVIKANAWPMLLNHDGPVYWVPVATAPEREFIEALASLDPKDADVSSLIEEAKELLAR